MRGQRILINDSGRKSCSGESDSDKYCTDDQFCSESEDEADEAQRQRALHANHDGAVQQQHLVSRLELLHQSELIIIQNEDDQRAAGDRGSHGASSDWTSQHGDVVRATRLPRSTSTSARTFSAGLRERDFFFKVKSAKSRRGEALNERVDTLAERGRGKPGVEPTH